MKAFKIPEATVIRLSVYSRFLDQIKQQGVITISSGEIAQGVGVSPAQVRKDLAYFGEFGTRGVGYNVNDLYGYLIRILGLTNQLPVVIVGSGKLGSALAMYGGFKERGFNVIGIFDNDPSKIGQNLEIYLVMDVEKLPQVVAERKDVIGIITVPSEEAQSVADLLVRAGIKAILNFSPRVLTVPEKILLRNVDLSVNLEILSFYLDAQKR